MDRDSEKEQVDQIDNSSHTDSKNALAEFDFTPEEQRAIIRRIDRRLITTVGVMYCVSLMDRTNLGAALIAGMGVDLVLISNRYAIVSLVFFITYILLQPPSTIITRKLGPRAHLASITFLWGITMLGMGFVKQWDQLAALRIVLGVLEAGFFPGCVYLLSTWYTRYEVGVRYSVFYLIGSVAAAFAGILAYGIMQMQGIAGYNGWRWIFIIEGILTCVVAIAGYWLLVDFPDSKRESWRFLGKKERDWIVARVNADRGDAKLQAFNLKSFLGAGTDPKIWAYGMIFFNTTTITYALAFFLPLILTQNMGFDVGTAQCLVAPPYAFAGIIMFVSGLISDKYRIRGPIIIFNMLLCIIGLPIIGWHTNANVRYFGIFLTTAGANANVPAVMTYQANNIRGQWKRALCSATLVGLGGAGGIAGSLVFRSQDAPGYKPGLYACLACAGLNIILVCVLSLTFKIQNGRADAGKVELESSDEDYQPGFRYTY